MRRLITLIATAALLALVAPAPAQAKVVGLHHVEVTGPGVDGTLVVSRNELGRIMNQSSPAAIALDGFWSPIKEQARPNGSLGPEFRITYIEEWLMDGRDLVRLTALLYPYAEGGPVTYVLPDQKLDPLPPKHVTQPGWLPYPEELVDNLRAAGLPSEGNAERAMATDPAAPWPWAFGGIALALLLWIAGSGAEVRPVALGRN